MYLNVRVNIADVTASSTSFHFFTTLHVKLFHCLWVLPVWWSSQRMILFILTFLRALIIALHPGVFCYIISCVAGLCHFLVIGFREIFWKIWVLARLFRPFNNLDAAVVFFSTWMISDTLPLLEYGKLAWMVYSNRDPLKWERCEPSWGWNLLLLTYEAQVNSKPAEDVGPPAKGRHLTTLRLQTTEKGFIKLTQDHWAWGDSFRDVANSINDAESTCPVWTSRRTKWVVLSTSRTGARRSPLLLHFRNINLKFNLFYIFLIYLCPTWKNIFGFAAHWIFLVTKKSHLPFLSHS